MPRQLRMIWPVPKNPKKLIIPEEYTLRTFQKGNEKKYINLLNLAGFSGEKTVPDILKNSLSPKGIHFISYKDCLVATACGLDKNNKGELGWVAVDPEHRGKNLGMIVCTAVIEFLLKHGYKEIYLLTDHWRIPALKTYLKLGFEPEIDGSDDRFLWTEIYEKFNLKFTKPKKAKYVKKPKGEEIAYRTLNLEKVKEPCMLTWCMKREFFQKLSHVEDIYINAPHTVIESFIRCGINLCSQFLMPSPKTEHLAVNPFAVKELLKDNKENSKILKYKTPEEVRDFIDTLPDPDTLEKNFNIEKEVEEYAKPLVLLREMAKGEILFISDFGQSDFMDGYTRFGYENYLTALALYPEYLKKYYAYTGELGRLKNIAIVKAIKKYNLAPFVYGGQDICFNNGPICSVETLDNLYFPHLINAVEPLHKAGIKIIWHCDGDVRPIVDRLINKVKVSGLQGFQEETGCTLEEMAKYKTKEGKKLTLWGSISVTTTLPYKTVEEIKKDVERCFKIAASGGGFVLAPSSSILPEVPYENIIAMYDHGLKFGREFLSSF